MEQTYPRVLIVGTIPYNKNTSSRAFDAYFHNWEKENLRQIFSNTKKPVKGHCSSLYQITDQRLLKRRFGRVKEVGVIFNDEELPIDWENSNLEVGNKFVEWLYQLGSKESSLKHLGRKWVWKKKYWDTEQLRSWLDEFKPDCVFLAFSDDFFILEIALFVAERYNIPIMSCIGDDYYFNDQKSISILYHIYRKKYKKLVDRVLKRKGSSAIYIGDKIRDKYNEFFGLNGQTIYLSSDIVRHEFRYINKENLKISYCGNIRLGRNKSLVDIANALQSINSQYKLDVYSAEKNTEYTSILSACEGINYYGAIPYKQVMGVMRESDIVIIVEGFGKKDVSTVKYSLSTKAADSMATGGQILVYGSANAGVIEYMKSTQCAVVCTNRIELKEKIEELLSDLKLQKQLYDKAVEVFQENHNKEKNLQLVENMFEDLVDSYAK